MDRITGVQLFARIVETGSFSKASSDLGITQPTATKHVAALEAQLGARLLNRNTRGVSATEIGALYYEKCKAIQRELDEADSLAALLQSKVRGQLRISTSVAFGRRVVTPLALKFMREHPDITLDLSFDDRYVNLVEQGVDVALRMGRLADSALGARYLGSNPWLTAAAPDYLARRGTPNTPAELASHDCLVYSSVQGDDRWTFTSPGGDTAAVPVKGTLFISPVYWELTYVPANSLDWFNSLRTNMRNCSLSPFPQKPKKASAALLFSADSILRSAWTSKSPATGWRGRSAPSL